MDAIPQKQTRNSRWSRDPAIGNGGEPVTVYPTERDIEIFKLLARYRYLPSDYIHAFIGGNEKALGRRLNLLARKPNLYLARPHQQRQNADANYRRLIYQLDERGSRVLRERGTSFLSKSYHHNFAHELMVAQITASPHLRLILGQVAPRLDLGFTMNNRRILIANLSKGTIGEQATNFLGSLLVSHLQLIAMERSVLPPQDRVAFFAHVDEFQTFSSDAFASLLSEARKFALHFALANQFADQLSNAVRSAVIGNAGTLIVFRVGGRDAELLAPEFRPMDVGGLTDQQPFTAWLRGIGDDRFSSSRICTIRSVPPR